MDASYPGAFFNKTTILFYFFLCRSLKKIYDVYIDDDMVKYRPK